MSATRAFAVLSALCAALLTGPARADHQVLIVCAATSGMETISSMELRKVFLSVPVTKADQSIEGLRNLSDEHLNEIFLQTLVSMTARVYERRLLTLTIQTGRPRPRTLDDIDAIVSLLKENSNLITYMWSEDFHAAQGLKILKVLWQD